MVINFMKRFGELVVVLLLVSFGTFMLVSLMSNDPAVVILGEGHAPEEYEALREEIGLNDPLWTRYTDWLFSALQGDLGESVVPPYSDVLDRVAAALPVSVELALLGMLIAVVLSIPLAMLSAYHAGGRLDRAISAGAFGVLSLPGF